MQKTLESEIFAVRLRNAISFAWSIFMKKAGNDLLPINKEASMQLQYAYILKQVLPLIKFSKDEKSEIELEVGVDIGEGIKEVDLFLKGWSSSEQHNIAVEMKCYRTYAASGGLRGATDIFMKDVYEDLRLLERYIECGHAHQGVFLVMNDLERLVNPKKKDAKCWAYDISNHTKIHNVHLTTPIGGKEISIYLKKTYCFSWEKHGPYWFMEIEGIA
jgi:hypothetical protein